MSSLNTEVSSLSNDLSSISIAELEVLSDSVNATKIFLVIDGRGGLEERMEDAGYEKVYISYYWTKLPSLFSEIYTGEESKHEYFEQHFSVYELK